MESTTTIISKSVKKESEISKQEEGKAISSRPPRSNKASSKLKILHFSDTHNFHRKIGSSYEFDLYTTKPDVLIFSGDFSSMGYQHEINDFIEWFTKLPSPYKILVAGNHDISFDENKSPMPIKMKPVWVREALEVFLMNKNNFYLENESCEIEGIHFWGSPITPWFYGDFWAFNKHRGEEIQKVWSKIPSSTQVLITHGPPARILDFSVGDRVYTGCEDLLNVIRRIKPLLHLFGHIHEAYGYEHNGDTHFFNGSICNLAYRPTNKPWLIDADFTNREIQIL